MGLGLGPADVVAHADGGGDLAVEAHGAAQGDEGAPGGAVLEEDLVQTPGGLALDPDVHLEPGCLEGADGAARGGGVAVLVGDHDARELRCEDPLEAGRGAARRVAGLDGHVEGAPPARLARRVEGAVLGVGLPCLEMEALADDLVALGDDGAGHGVGAGPAAPLDRQLDGALHEDGIGVHDWFDSLWNSCRHCCC
ncbi:hypothetical protein D3C86_1286330 [compost metagenome]